MKTIIQTQLLVAVIACFSVTLRGQTCSTIQTSSGFVCRASGAQCSSVTDGFGDTGKCTTEGTPAGGQTCECKGRPDDYAISASPSNLTASQGSNVVATIIVTPINGFTGSVALSESGLPAGVTASVAPVSQTVSQLTLAVSPSASIGAFSLTVVGASGTVRHSASLSLSVTAMSTVPAGFAYCATEGNHCNLTQAADVAYGSGTVFVVKSGVVGGISCDNVTFGGDPTVGVPKMCYVIPRYRICAVENQTCSGTGFRDVMYAAQGKMHVQLHKAGDVPCNNATFGDPAVGVIKACYDSTALTPPAWGFADLHSHPATHLAFGADASGNDGLLWGKPGFELTTSSTADAIAAQLPACTPDTHFGTLNDPVHAAADDFVHHGTHATIIQQIDNQTEVPHGPYGSPSFTDWPVAQSELHQGMHITEIRNAYDGGLRLLFASTTDNQLLSDLWHIGMNFQGNPIPTPDAHFDFNSATKQIAFIQQLAAVNNSWMQVVTTPADARQAIKDNKLAIVLSIEQDSLYPDQMLNLIQNYGVRHVIPVHLSNNTIGGTAVYDDLFNANTYFLTGSFFTVQSSKCVNKTLGTPKHLVHGPVGAIKTDDIDKDWLDHLEYPSFANGGHENTLGLAQGEFLRLMRTGVLLDVVHMDEQSARDAIALGLQYHFPLMDSHTGLRDDGPDGTNCSALPPNTNERSIPYSQVKNLGMLGGVLGLGTTPILVDDPVEQWLQNYVNARNLMGGRGVALGTDFNGLSPQLQIFNPAYRLDSAGDVDVFQRFGPPAGSVRSSIQKFALPGHQYDFAKDGIANYGLIPDFLQAVSAHPALSWTPASGTPPTPNPDAMPELAALFHSAEDVIEMWERAEVAAATIPAPEGVQCSVFDDNYTNVVGPSDAVFINPGQQACVPGGPNGICRKWFGRCMTTVTHTAVTFSVFNRFAVFNDDKTRTDPSAPSDAIFINDQEQACVPDGSGGGTCRQWFGSGVTQDGRTVRCSVFNDGYADVFGPTDAIAAMFRDPQSSAGQTQQLCMANGSPFNNVLPISNSSVPWPLTGLACHKWFGRCVVEQQ